jgi:hypothetical protein
MWKKEIEHYRARCPDYAEALKTAEALFEAQEAIERSAPAASSPPSLSSLLAAADRLAETVPDGRSLAAALRGVAAAVSPAPDGALEWLRTIAEGTGETERLRSFAASVLVPFYAGHRQNGIVQPAGRRGTCPSCDGVPFMGRYRNEDGALVLGCSLCRTEWLFPRTACAECGRDDPAGQRYLYTEGRRGHRVLLCERCGAYLKVSDERVAGRATVLAVEDVVTRHLDLLAETRGYHVVGRQGTASPSAQGPAGSM